MRGTPLTPWTPSPTDSELIDSVARAGVTVRILRRPVQDGELVALVQCEPPHHIWHLSLAHWPKRSRKHRRWPTWDELIEARNELVPANADMVLHVPTIEAMTTNDPTIHLYECPEHGRINGHVTQMNPDSRVPSQNGSGGA